MAEIYFATIRLVAFSERVSPYTDNLNSWLGQILQRDAGHVTIEIVDVETTGTRRNYNTLVCMLIISRTISLAISHGVTKCFYIQQFITNVTDAKGV